MEVEANIAITSSSRCLVQICEHMSHRFFVEFDASKGIVDLKEGASVEFHAGAEGLRIVIRAPEQSIGAIKQLISRELDRLVCP